jgi:hypothetical protein
VRVLRSDGTSHDMPESEARYTETCGMRRFVLDRVTDIGGVSGTGVVAEGVVFTDGTTALRWTTDKRSTAIYDSVTSVILIHGHNGATMVRWVDG